MPKWQRIDYVTDVAAQLSFPENYNTPVAALQKVGSKRTPS
jgi:hypothetical protein